MRKSITTGISLLFLLQILLAQNPMPVHLTDSVLTHADQMPYFMGCSLYDADTVKKRHCSDLELVRYLSTYLEYPSSARQEGIEGTVYVSFIIDKLGYVRHPYLLMDIGGGCGNAALDVVSSMPPWEPATHQGETVNVKMNLPVQFFLRAEEREKIERYQLSWGHLTGETVSKDVLINNLSQKVYVRGPEGNNRYIDELEFTYEKDDRYFTASSRGEISDELRKVVDKAKHGGVFTIYASLQDNGEFVLISRSFEITR